MKKIIISVTIIAFLNLIGCYYQEQMNPGEYKYDENETLKLTSKDSVYTLKGENYYFKNDTLFATVSKKIDKETTLKTTVEIPTKNIESVEVERTNAVATTFLVLGILAIPIAMIVSAIVNDPYTPQGSFPPHGI